MSKSEKEVFLSKLFLEDDFEDQINTVVASFMKEYVSDGFIKEYDGKEIHYYSCIHPNEKGSIAISHGFCEFFEKYAEVVYELFQMGYSVFFLEHRGHGSSFRDIEDQPDMVYIEDYDEYVEDYKKFMDQVVMPKAATGNVFLFAHSMGGCIAGLFLEKYPQYFKAAILSSPMMQMNTGKVPKIAVQFLMVWSKLMKWDKKYAPGQSGYDGKYVFGQSGTLSEARYRYAFMLRERNPKYRTYGGSYAWSRASIKASKKVRKEAWRIQIPLLMFQAGNDTMVIPKGQEEFLAKVKGSQKVVFPKSKHEIFNATEDIRKEYYGRIWDFYEEHC